MTEAEAQRQAEQVWWEAFDSADCQADSACDKAIGIIAAALRQAYREGVEAGIQQAVALFEGDPTRYWYANDAALVIKRLLSEKGGA